jgi:hypothetical protein
VGDQTKAVTVKAISFDSRLYVVTGAIYAPNRDAWNLQQLYLPAHFEARFPGEPIRIEPRDPETDADREDFYTGVRVKVGGKEMVIGTDKRRVVRVKASPSPKDLDDAPVVLVFAVGMRVALDFDREVLGTITATRPMPSSNDRTCFVEWDALPGKKKGSKAWCSASGLVQVEAAKPAPPTVTLDTLLEDLAREGGRDPVVGYCETLAAMKKSNVVQAGDLIARARTMGLKDFNNSLYAAIRSCIGVSADMAKRVAGQLEDLLRPLWGDPEAKAKKVAAKGVPQCRVCKKREGDVTEQHIFLTFALDDLCIECAELAGVAG